MRYFGEIENILLDNKNNAHITLKVANYRQAQELSSLQFDSKVYSVDMKERKSKRSLEQNNLMWGLLGLLEKKTDECMMNWYHKALIDARAKVEYILATEEMFPTLITFKDFRSVRIVGKRNVVNKNQENIEMNIYELIIGTSKMNVKEMNQVIDIILGYCSELNINTDLLEY